MEINCYCSRSNRFAIQKIFLLFFFFLSCYSASLNLENTVATLFPYFIYKNWTVVFFYYSFSLIQTFFLLLYCALGFSSESSLSSKTPLSQNQPSLLLSLTKKLTPCLSITVRSTTCDEEWSSENIGLTLNIDTQNFDLIGLLSCLNLLVYRTSWWFGGFEWFSIVLHHYLGLGFRFLVLSLCLFFTLFLIFSLFFVLN